MDTKNESRNDKYDGPVQPKPVVQKIWGWDCSEKGGKPNAKGCKSDTVYVPVNGLPPSSCPTDSSHEGFDKHPGDLQKVTKSSDGGFNPTTGEKIIKKEVKIIDMKQKTYEYMTGKEHQGKVLKEYTE